MFLPPEAAGRRYCRQTFNLSLFYNGRSAQLTPSVAMPAHTVQYNGAVFAYSHRCHVRHMSSTNRRTCKTAAAVTLAETQKL